MRCSQYAACATARCLPRSILSAFCIAALPLLLCPTLLSAGTKGADPKAAPASPQSEGERLFVVNGTCTVWIGPDTVRLGPGDYCAIPLHTPREEHNFATDQAANIGLRALGVISLADRQRENLGIALTAGASLTTIDPVVDVVGTAIIVVATAFILGDGNFIEGLEQEVTDDVGTRRTAWLQDEGGNVIAGQTHPQVRVHQFPFVPHPLVLVEARKWAPATDRPRGPRWRTRCRRPRRGRGDGGCRRIA